MYILVLIVVGHLVLAACIFVARLLSKGGRTVDGVRPFIWVWLIVSIANGAVGVLQADIPWWHEALAFVPIFGVPVAAAWYLSRRQRAKTTQ